MTTLQRTLLHLLRLTLQKNADYNSMQDTEIDWSVLYQISATQDVLGILYPVIEHFSEKIQIDHNLVSKWKNQLFYHGAYQLDASDHLVQTLSVLNKSGIRYILFKGPAVSRFYQHPEFRIMKDIDILVEQQNIQNAATLFESIGYQTTKDSFFHETHIEMFKPDHFSIEIHKSFWNRQFLGNKDTTRWDEHIWSHVKTIDYRGVPVTVLSPEDELINLIIHFATHYTYADVNLRQLYDITVYLDHVKNDFDWNYAFATLNFFGMTLFTRTLLTVLSRNFGINPFQKYFEPAASLSDAFIEDFFSDYGTDSVKAYKYIGHLLSLCIIRYHKSVLFRSFIFEYAFIWQLNKGEEINTAEIFRISAATSRIFRQRCKLLRSMNLL